MTSILKRLSLTGSGPRSARRPTRPPSERYRRLTFESMESRVVLSATSVLALSSETTVFDVGDFKVVGADEFILSPTTIFQSSLDTIRLNLSEVPIIAANDFIDIGVFDSDGDGSLFSFSGSDQRADLVVNGHFPVGVASDLELGATFRAFGSAFPAFESAFSAQKILLAPPANYPTEGGSINIDEVPKYAIPDPGSENDTARASSSEDSRQNTKVEPSLSRTAIEGTTGAREIMAARGRALAIEVALAGEGSRTEASQLDRIDTDVGPRGPGPSPDGDQGPQLPLEDDHIRPTDGHSMTLGRHATSEETEARIDAAHSTWRFHRAIEPTTSSARDVQRPVRGSVPSSLLLENSAASDDSDVNRDLSPASDEQALTPQQKARAIVFARLDEAADIQRGSVPWWIENHSRQPIAWALLALASTGGVLYTCRSLKLHESEQHPPRRRRPSTNKQT